MVFVLPNVEGGGTHRVMLTLLKHLNRDKFKLHLIVIINKGEFRRVIPSDIDVTYLNVDWVPKGFFPLFKAIRRIKPKIILSGPFSVSFLTLMMKPFLPKGIRFIVRESTIVSQWLEDPKYPKYKRLIRVLYKMLYPNADLVICQSDYMAQDLARIFHVDLSILKKIFNPVDIDSINAEVRHLANPYSNYGEGPHIISAGRLCYAKNFERLISAFKIFQHDHKNARLWILGQGLLKEELLNQCKQLEISDVVFFPGFQPNPYLWFTYADLFVLSSRYEGMPNVLLEALACGCPVLATDAPGGTREIMELTGNLDRLVAPESLRILPEHFKRSDSSNAINLLRTHFGLSEIVKKYEQALLL